MVEAARDGDFAAFEVLYRRHRDWVVRLAYRFTNDREDALDTLQETFAYLLGKLPRLYLTAKMTTFLYPVVKHTAIAIAKKTRRNRSDLSPPEQPTTDDDPIDPREELTITLSALPEPQREVLLMRYVDDMTLQEIAQALSVPLGTIKSRIHTALTTLRERRGSGLI